MPLCLRLDPSQARQAFGAHGHVAGLYVMLDPPRPGGDLWAISRAQAKGPRAGTGRDEEASITSGPYSSQLLAGLPKRPRHALLVQDCTVKGAAEWDAANRATAGGIVERTQVQGSRILMHCRTGNARVRFGPSSRELGAQALESILPENGPADEGGDGNDRERQGPRLRLRWRGLAGAGVGLAHGLARAGNVMWTDYPGVQATAGIAGLKVGGNHEEVVETVVPALTRMMVGLDDTDSPEQGATWVLGPELARRLEASIEGLKVLDQRLIQLWSGIEEKTSNCVALGLSLALPPHQVSAAREIILDLVAQKATSPEAAVALFQGVRAPPELVDLCHTARRERVSLETVMAIASGARVVMEPVVGHRGLIGALAAIGGLDLGPEVAAPAKGSK